MPSSDYSKKFKKLVFNWKLRLVVSALFSISGLAFLISTTSGYIIEDFEILDQTIVGVAVFVIVIPIYLIIADLPKINEYTLADILNQAVPELDRKADLVLKKESELSEAEKNKRKEIEDFFEEDELYRFLPNRPIKQAVMILAGSLILTLGVSLYFQ